MKNIKHFLLNTFLFCLSVVLSFVICFYLLDDLLLKYFPVASQTLYILVRLFIAFVLFVAIKKLLQNEKKMIDKTVVNLSILFYLIILVAILFLSRSSISTSSNLVPFKTILSYITSEINTPVIVSNLLGNMFLLMPLGIILKTKIKSIKLYIVLSWIILFFIEISQLIFKVGSFDIDDILLNSFGFYVGYLINKLYNFKKQRAHF